MRPRTLLFGSALISTGVVAYTLFSPGGLPRMQRQQHDAAALQRDVELLRGQNERLQQDAQLLQGDAPGAEAYLEDVIREELGYVKADEHLLLFETQGDASATSPLSEGQRP